MIRVRSPTVREGNFFDESREICELPSPTVGLLTLFSPVNSREILWIEKLWIKCHVGTQLGIIFPGDNFSIDAEDDFRRHPPAAELPVLVELGLLRLHAILAGRANHP